MHDASGIMVGGRQKSASENFKVIKRIEVIKYLKVSKHIL
jgi:hypothetical protein